jgi:beta-lactamase class D OXA-29
MKRIILFFCYVILCTTTALTAENSFLAKENGKVLRHEGDCSTRHSPGCDFSIALSLMGFDSGVLENENRPVWSYRDGYETFLNVWKKPHTPRTWIVDSCVWYSGNIVDEIGFEKIKDYVYQFEYGNKDVTGMSCVDWPGALMISAREQVEFLQRFIDRELHISTKAYEMTEKILFIQDLPGGWKLYGKTGVGEEEDPKRTGWFVGWIAKDDRRIPFASCVLQLQKQDTIPSFLARSNAFTKLFWLINDLEK